MSQELQDFSNHWKDRGDEKSDTHKFWLEFIRDVLGLDFPEQYIEFEKRVEIGHVSFIDAYIPSTGIVIEQKNINVDLDKPAFHSDGSSITPFEQAKRYRDWLPASQQGRYIIVNNFRELRIHDMERPKAPPEVIALSELSRKKSAVSFLVNPDKIYTPEERLSIQAGMLARKLRDELIKRYVNPDDADDLNILCVRLVFLLYAEDSGLFEKNQFHDYLKSRSKTARQSLIELFNVLSKAPEDRDPYIDFDLKAFKQVNGGLFDGRNIIIPQLDGEPLRIILEDMSEKFDWSGISPTIFGAVFENVLRDKERHEEGIHYTSQQNIHKLIDALFLENLTSELDGIISKPDSAGRTKELQKFQDKLASFKFFDPACGSGNFLTETYISLRRLENKVLYELNRQKYIAFSKEELHIKVTLSQFYGIEIDDFAVSVARTALYIAETQMLAETISALKGYNESPLPLKSYDNITHANALRVNWSDIVTPDEKLYIISNPPFLGYSSQTKDQKKDIIDTYSGDYNKAGKIDYVSGWYYKTAEYIKGTKTKAAFVSTNSICQGEQVIYVWKPLVKKKGLCIDFAYQEFKWAHETNDKEAQVHVVIIGLGYGDDGKKKRLYGSDGSVKFVDHINPYLIEGPDVFPMPRPDPLCPDEAYPMRAGGKVSDDGNLIMTHEEMIELLETDPLAEKLIRPYMGAFDFIQRKPRYCLWLVGASPELIRKCPRVMERIKRVKEFRQSSKKPATQRKAQTPTLFDEVIECTTNYIAIPATSSEKRFYVPIDWLPPDVIPGTALRVMPNGTLYQFGVLTSRVHMAWMRRVCGRLKSDYRYNNTIVYNCFVWPRPTQRQREKIEGTAQAVLEARALYPESNFASLYDDNVMPVELREAHKRNDAAVCEAYGWKKDISEYDVVARLFEMYYAIAGDDD